MKKIMNANLFLAFFCLVFSCKKNSASTVPPSTTDSFMVTVNNGYGCGSYKMADTVHIFSNAWTVNQLFGKWSGDVALLNAPDEWHTWFIMPAKNVALTGSIVNSKDFTLKYEQIRGRDRLKPVYYYFPQAQKGIVYLLHGTGGSAATIVNEYEWQQLIKDLVNDNFGVIVTESEESTTQIDANGDGKIRWYLAPVDTIANIDYANIRIIADTFYQRGLMGRTKPRYSIGMSDGGFFSAALSYMYNFKAGVQYCAQGSANALLVTTIPTQFCMAANDNNPSVGSAGNAQALSYYYGLNARGVCSKYYVNARCPIYSQRFARSGLISSALSASIFNELKSKGYIGAKNYYNGYSDALMSALQGNPSNFPVISTLAPYQQQFMLAQINISVADHHIYSDYNRATLHFLDNQCQ